MSLYLQTRDGYGIDAASEAIYLYFAGTLLKIEQVATETGPVITCPNHPANPAEYNVVFHYYIQTPGVSGGVVAEATVEEGFFDQVLGDLDGNLHSISLPFSCSVGHYRLWRAETLNKGSGRDGTPVFASDRDIAESWQDDPPGNYAFTLGGLSYSGTQYWDAGFGLWVPEFTSPLVDPIIFGFQQWAGANAGIYMAFENVTLNGEALPFARYYYGTAMPTGPVYIDGVDGGWNLYANGNCGNPWIHEIEYVMGLEVDFSRFSVRDRDGALLGLALISGGFTANNYYPETLNWSTSP